MTRDFTLDEYRALLATLEGQGYRAHTFADYHAAGGALASPHVLLRHDVDRLPGRALALARVEAEAGVRATYFFRTRPVSFHPPTIRAVAALGHEIGYHYECLADTRGDVDAAWDLFRRELERFAPFGRVASIAMHGRPLSPWDSRAMWERHDYRAAGVALEAYRDIDWAVYRYVTDTGRCWDGRNNVRDRPPAGPSRSPWACTTTADLRTRIALERSNIVISTHPERWTAGVAGWLQVWLQDALTNVTKRLLSRPRAPSPNEGTGP